MKIDAKHVVALLGLVLITSGCIENGDEEIEGEVISVNSFTAEPDPAISGQDVTLRLFLENHGDATAEDVHADIGGPQIIQDEDDTWSVADGSASRMEDFGDLRSMEEGASPRNDDLALSTPDLEEGREIPYQFDASIIYGYETEASMTVEAASQEEIQDRGTSRTSMTASNSQAPLEVTLESGRTPIEFRSGDEVVSENICINVANTGLGEPFHPDEVPASETGEIDEMNAVNVTLENVGAFVWEEDEIGDDEYEFEMDLYEHDGMIQGTECLDLNVLVEEGNIPDEGVSDEISVEVDYGYIQEASTNVLVEGS